MNDKQKGNKEIAEALSEQMERGVYANDTIKAAIAALRNSVPQGVVDQIRWERDTALGQLAEIGKGLGSKMDDIVEAIKMRTGKVSAENPIHKKTSQKESDDPGLLYDGRCCEDICKHYPPGNKWPCVDCDIRIHDRAEM